MKIYVLRYSSEGETSHINEAFTNATDARKRFKELKREAERAYRWFKKNGTAYETPPVDMFNGPFEQYVKKYSIETVADLIRLVNRL